MLLEREISVDSFAGAGGASTGIQWATGRDPDIAINHDAEALRIHALNHPNTRHVCEDVWAADLTKLVAGRPVGLLWASPDCKHFSRAKGKTPVNRDIRSLAWVVVRWASQVRPRQIMLENVREFADWGPVVPQWTCKCGWKGTEGTRRRCPRCESPKISPTLELMPDPDRKGLTFRLFCNRLRGLGYKVEHRALNAADFGAPTHRRRLFLIARCDGQPIEWPEPTHGDPKKLDAAPLFSPLKPWRTAAECIDWSIPCPSIFDRKKPLADKTLRRIALGIKRYVLDNPTPFIVPITHTGERCGSSVADPFPTVTTATRGEHAIVTPTIVGVGGRMGQTAPASVEDPSNTITTKNDRAVVTPILVSTNHGDSGGRRAYPIDETMRTVCSSSRGGEALIAPTLIQTGYGERSGQAPRALDIEQPLGSVVAGGAKHALVSAFIAKHFGGMVGVPASDPLPTTTTKGCQNQVVASNLVRFNHDDAGLPVDAPAPTLTTNNHAALVYSFLVKYFGTAIGANLLDPAPTATTKHRFGLVTVTIGGELYVIVDIGMRMLTPRELARAQGFPDSYILEGTKTKQVALIGNSVPPQFSEALVRANSLQEAAS
jgi:DNA (cytosine-5)-methyltransferase 1